MLLWLREHSLKRDLSQPTTKSSSNLRSRLRYRMSIPQQPRDQRIDLLRGIALLVLVTDHFPANPLRRVMPVSLGLADMAETFVLLSGIVAGLGIRKQRTVQACTRRRLKRAAVLYISYVATGCVIVSMVRHFRIGVLAQSLPAHLLSGSLSDLLLNVARLDGQVSHLAILLLYLWLAVSMLFLPDTFWRSPERVWVCSFFVYLATQVFEVVQLPASLQVSTYYNPFAWQFLFVTAAAFTVLSPEEKTRHLNRGTLFHAALLIQGVLIFCTGLGVSYNYDWINKPNLGILRYLHVVSAALILREVLPLTFSERWQSLLKPVFLCGQQSLWVYCGGSLVVVCLAALFSTRQSIGAAIAINIIAWSCCFAIAWTTEKIKFLSLRRTAADVD